LARAARLRPGGRRAQKKPLSPPLLLAQEEEVAQVIGRYQSLAPDGAAVAALEVLVRTAVFKSRYGVGF
jgi:hypothetical protein